MIQLDLSEDWAKETRTLRKKKYDRRYHRKYYLENRDLIRAKAKKYYEENKEACLGREKKYRERIGKVIVLAKSRKANQIHNAKLKTEALAAYGNRCACCGEDAPEFLTIDHVHGDGRSHRREVGRGHGIYRWLKKQGYPKDRFQILCFNCNCAKGTNMQCPHEKVDVTRVLRGIAC